uniref:Glutaminase n=1 Tax=Panagrolaimus sp. ES5 TaxID=591445 RepID=A0AC34FVS2_9BILA
MDSKSRKISNATLQQWSPLGEAKSKESIVQTISQTAETLSNAFICDQQPEDLIYNLFKIPNKEEASIGKLLSLLKNFGLQESDPRLKPMMQKIRDIEQAKEEQFKEARDPKHWKLGKEDFQKCISESLSLISRTLQNDLVVPSWTQFCNRIKDIYVKCKPINDGKVADYIPQLSRFDPNLWGVSICTIDGQRASWGDSKIPFCVQSVSKAFNYSLAASDLGADMVHHFVGQEP